MHVLFEDNHLLVVNKPAGLLTQPNDTDDPSLEELAKKWIKEKHQKPGNVFLMAVHRIDKPVSGIVVFAKTSKALSRLNAFMRDKKYTKIYHAIVEGVPKVREATLEHYLIHDEYKATVSHAKNPLAKLARLHYITLHTAPQSSLLEIELETGRYHQIRVQLATAGHPIQGDKKYGGRREPLSAGVIALHHHLLEFPHPVKEERVKVKAPYPAYWKF